MISVFAFACGPIRMVLFTINLVLWLILSITIEPFLVPASIKQAAYRTRGYACLWR